MTELEINQIIHEAMGKCWHEDDTLTSHYRCKHCGAESMFAFIRNPSYTSSWSDYGPMLEECMKKEWWPDFINFGLIYESKEVIPTLLNPLKGSIAIAEFVVANPEYFKGE